MKKFDRIGLQSGLLVLVTLILHHFAGGQVPNVLIIFAIWLSFFILGLIFFKFFKTLNGSLALSLVSQPFLHFIFEKTAVNTNVTCVAMNDHSYHYVSSSCNEIANSGHSHAGSLTVMVIFHILAIFFIQIFSILADKVINKTKIFINRIWNFVNQNIPNLKFLNPLKDIKAIPVNLFLLELVLKNIVIRRGPPIFS
ncbi:MAG: hypothetical protein RLZZ37_838 [Actinomycetota bacterium]